jgi:hypothetical protein
VVNATARPLYSQESDPVHVVRRLGEPRPMWTGAENPVSTRNRSPDRPARMELLYRLRNISGSGSSSSSSSNIIIIIIVIIIISRYGTKVESDRTILNNK